MNPSPQRPVVFDYGLPSEFLKDLLVYYKSTGRFSLRQRAEKAGSCSQALVSQILSGKRKLKRDQLTGISEIFKLTQVEYDFIDKKLFAKASANSLAGDKLSAPKVAKNHLLSHWLNPYVKDLVHLKGFSPQADKLFSMLQGIATPAAIAKSIHFLFTEGFWRKTPAGEIVPEDPMTITTNNIPNEKISAFHKKALEVAQRGLATLPPDRRQATTVLLSVDDNHLDELRGLLDSFQAQLSDFIERYPKGKDSLIQVTMHLTPVGRKDV